MSILSSELQLCNLQQMSYNFMFTQGSKLLLQFSSLGKNHFIVDSLKTLHEKPYFPGPGVSWKAQKGQVIISFPSTILAQKKNAFSIFEKFKNRNFSVISKYHLSINCLA